MIITHYRYKISMGYMMKEEIEVRETERCYIGSHCRILKDHDGIPVLKDRTSYPYVDFYSTENPSREFAIENILELFKEQMK